MLANICWKEMKSGTEPNQSYHDAVYVTNLTYQGTFWNVHATVYVVFGKAVGKICKATLDVSTR